MKECKNFGAKNLSSLERIEVKKVSEAKIFEEKAAIQAEFGKIVCISTGYITRNSENDELEFKTKSFYGEDEKTS